MTKTTIWRATSRWDRLQACNPLHPALSPHGAGRISRSGLDLQTPDGQRIARELASKCHVVIQNFKLGLGYDRLREDNPGLVYCSITGYERSGSEGARPGYDLVVQGEAGPSIVPYGVFDAADGPLVITVGNNAQFARFCSQVIERPDLAQDERFATNTGRSINREALMVEINHELGRRQRKDLLARLADAGIPCGEVLGLLEALRSPRTERAGLVVDKPSPEVGTVPVMAPPYRLDGVRMPVRMAPPLLGQDTRDVLSELLGVSDKEMERLKQDGVL